MTRTTHSTRAEERPSPGPEPVRGVVVGYDGSPSARTALVWAAGEAARRGSALAVLYAADWYATAAAVGVTAGLEQSADAVAREAAEEAGRQVRAALGAAGGAVAQVVVEPVARLTDATTALVAASRGADLLVVGNRGRGALAGALLGSVAFSVTAAAHCPVVVVRGEASSALAPGPDRPVVLGVDGSPGAARALQFAASAAARAHAPLQVLAAWTPPEVADDGFAVIAHQELVEATQQTARDRAHEAVDAVRLLAPGVVVQDLVVQQPARRALAEASRGAGLVVVGARGHGALTGLFLGSVSHAVIHSAACPVAVVRAPHP